jgi:hypothetical protein
MGVGFEQDWVIAMARELRILAMALVIFGLGGVAYFGTTFILDFF